jgi:hypothetical protein
MSTRLLTIEGLRNRLTVTRVGLAAGKGTALQLSVDGDEAGDGGGYVQLSRHTIRSLIMLLTDYEAEEAGGHPHVEPDNEARYRRVGRWLAEHLAMCEADPPHPDFDGCPVCGASWPADMMATNIRHAFIKARAPLPEEIPTFEEMRADLDRMGRDFRERWERLHDGEEEEEGAIMEDPERTDESARGQEPPVRLPKDAYSPEGPDGPVIHVQKEGKGDAPLWPGAPVTENQLRNLARILKDVYEQTPEPRIPETEEMGLDPRDMKDGMVLSALGVGIRETAWQGGEDFWELGWKITGEDTEASVSLTNSEARVMFRQLYHAGYPEDNLRIGGITIGPGRFVDNRQTLHLWRHTDSQGNQLGGPMLQLDYRGMIRVGELFHAYYEG